MSAPLVPELTVSDISASLDFYTRMLGFSVLYDRPEERFAYLAREGAELMIEQPVDRAWITGDLARPFGRGINFQIEVTDVDSLRADVERAGVPVFMDIEEAWYRAGAAEVGNRQFLVQDPDGYLLRFFQDLGSRPA